MAVVTMQSPLPGTFYRKPAPDQPAFKQDGDAVAVGDTLGLVEVMKTFTPVVAEAAGRVVRFLVEDEDPVTAGQAILEIEC